MARVKLSEYRAKSLLVDDYQGVSLTLDTVDQDAAKLDDNTSYVVKVDQGVKKRGKQGLLKLHISKDQAAGAVRQLAEHGYDRFIAEPMLEHHDSEEHYLNIERARDGKKYLYSPRGGVDIEDNSESIQQTSQSNDLPLSQSVLQHIVDVMDQQQLSSVEINPLVVQGDEYHILDAAVFADSAGVWMADWSDDDIVEASAPTEPERTIAELNDGSPASFSFRVLNPDGAIWLLLSGGGASITIADEAANCGRAETIGNYGEYSGGPTREETQLYTEAVLSQMFRSSAQPKALVIAGGVANFTDVRKTFAGIIDALKQQLDELKKHQVKVYVRRGGPNEVEGLAMMEEFLRSSGIFGSIHGSDDVLTVVVKEALEYIDA